MSEETQQNSQPQPLPSSDQPAEVPVQAAAAPRRSPLRRLGCGCALLIWFLILLSPCVVIVLATQGQITFLQGDLPGQELRIWLIQEAGEQGLGISTTSALQIQPDAACVQTSVSYILWRGSGEPATYCECYERTEDGADWSLVSTGSGVCTSP